MESSNDFARLFDRIQSGDEAAARELVQKYEKELLREVRRRLRDPNLRRVLDSMDICQSVLANFFPRAADRQFELKSSEDLKGLLIEMVKNKICDHARAQKTQKRDTQRMHPQSVDEMSLADSDETPSMIASKKETLERIRERLSPAELQIAELWCDGQPWESISVRIKESPEALRKRLERAIKRVRVELEQPEGGF